MYNERMYSNSYYIILTQILMFNFLMLFSLLRHNISFPSMYYCYFLNNNQSCHSDTSEEVHVQELLGRGLLHNYILESSLHILYMQHVREYIRNTIA